MKLTKRDVDDVYRLDFGSGTAPVFLSEEELDELRAYLQAERDEALGRWRDPEHPDLVCYPVAYDLDAVLVMYEGDMTRYYATRSTWKDVTPYYVSEVARRYFAAHPEPKPWDAAQPDEVWVLTINNDREEVFRCGERGLYSLKTGNPIGSLLSCGSNKITAGRRILAGGRQVSERRLDCTHCGGPLRWVTPGYEPDYQECIRCGRGHFYDAEVPKAPDNSQCECRCHQIPPIQPGATTAALAVEAMKGTKS